MAWIELHDTLPDHHKVIEVATALKMDKDLVVGKLIRLWVWALNNREDGIFKAQDVSTLAEIMRFKGKPQRLIEALVQARFLDYDGCNYTIHDWDERVGMLLAKREVSRSQARERQRKKREKNGNVTRDNSVTDENVTGECHACHAVTVPKPYLTDDEEEEKEDILTSRARAYARTQDVDGYEEYLTGAVKLAADIRARFEPIIRTAWTASFGKAPNPMQLSELVGMAQDFADSDPELHVIREALRLASTGGANNPIRYIQTLIQDWRRSGVKDEETLAAMQFERDYMRG